MHPRGIFAFCFLLSFLLHLAGVGIYEYWRLRRPLERPPVLAVTAPRFKPVERFSGAVPEQVLQQMRRLSSIQSPQAVPDALLSQGTSTHLDTVIAPDQTPLSQAAPERVQEALPERFSAADHASPYVRAGRTDVEGEFQLDLIDIGTLARAGKERAAIVLDPDGQRPREGFIHFTQVLLDGTADVFRLENLARYLRDHTPILADAHRRVVRDFASEELLKDPIHFFFPGPNRGRGTANDRLYMDATESALLGRYLREGGFLLIDAGLDMDDQRFLKAALAQVKKALGGQGRVYALPQDHPVYTAYYDYRGGFPGEHTRAMAPVDTMTIGDVWYYPSRLGCGDIPRGLWGIRHEDRLVGLLSDLDLKRRWSGESDPCAEDDAEAAAEDAEVGEEEVPITLPALRTATNIVVYALLRPESPTRRLVPFAWQKKTPPEPGRR